LCSQAAGLAALAVDLVTHPIDTLITRLQSPGYAVQYKTPSGAVSRSLFRGLYQGFGPTLLTGIPSSAAFWAVYERLKAALERDKARGGLARDVPLPLLHAASGAVGELVSTAIMSPAEVMKQNAQVTRSGDGAAAGTARPRGGYSVAVLRRFAAQPAKLWTGYTMMVASHLPGSCLIMGLYEHIKAHMTRRSMRHRDAHATEDPATSQVKVAALSASIAAGCTSGLLVPIDVIKTRMRLAAGGHGGGGGGEIAAVSARAWQTPARISFLTVARETFRVEGLRGFYRGAALTMVTATIGGGMYIGCYEAGKVYFKSFVQNRGVERIQEL
jgi:hypothetical protein